MINCAKRFGDVGCRLKLEAMSLAVIKTHRVTLEAFVSRNGERRR